ncbi:uncharacterized protein K452DRAFT_261405 [Aplosporella prunicola CBS 121167]|uniref:Anaphase-promoting complex subunit 4 WD40 domain-containing protein n=1 Tax=Aplosporella prunicola CBS 121167 TaxID=1176127 RepID=A0A6A6BSS0_9PEZI|nr:uncharacterized protein K452DRAFT_261405 [Aplosporella prunicola CBS 121167]KAF2147162.1 hypothetical protein K452DRAFT_261405 [Aplosporella prunicola CBS 121167]
MASISSLHSLTLELPPSCIEFVPGHRDLFVVGTYYLDRSADEDSGEVAEDTEKKSQQRSGSLLLFQLDGDEPKLIRTLPTPFAVFDLHFTPPAHGDPALLGAASSTGSLALYRVSRTQHPEIQHLRTLQLFPQNSLITFFAWHPRTPLLAGLALADGSAHLCALPSPDDPATDADPDPEAFTPCLAPLLAHDLEAWFLTFAPAGTALYTGGDDSALKFRSLPDPSTPPAAQWQDRRIHAAGVTAILPLAGPNLLLTGSYDDRVRLLRVPDPSGSRGGGVRRPVVLAEADLGGGVWRLKDITPEAAAGGEQREFVVLASCMHAGARVLRLRASSPDEGEEWQFEVLASFEEHQSMNYGSDVQPLASGEEGGQRTVVSTSFYDRLLCVWKW